MKKEYQTFVRTLQDLAQGQEIEVTIKDLTPGLRKYESKYVKAIVSSSPEKLPDGDTLWIRFATGTLHPQPWAIKIIQELDEFALKIKELGS